MLKMNRFFEFFHIGFGRDLSLGDSHNTSGHFDLVTYEPTITAGDKNIIKMADVKDSYKLLL